MTGASTSGTHILRPPIQLHLPRLNKESPFGMTSKILASRWFDNFPAGLCAQDLHTCRVSLYTEVCCPHQALKIVSDCKHLQDGREMPNAISGAIGHVKSFDLLTKYVFKKIVCIRCLSQSAVRCVFCLRPMRGWHRRLADLMWRKPGSWPEGNLAVCLTWTRISVSEVLFGSCHLSGDQWYFSSLPFIFWKQCCLSWPEGNLVSLFPHPSKCHCRNQWPEGLSSQSHWKGAEWSRHALELLVLPNLEYYRSDLNWWTHFYMS